MGGAELNAHDVTVRGGGYSALVRMVTIAESSSRSGKHACSCG